jgi:hypothetical protein
MDIQSSQIRIPVWQRRALFEPAKRKVPRKRLLIALVLVSILGTGVAIISRLLGRRLMTLVRDSPWLLLPTLLTISTLVIIILWRVPKLQVARSEDLTRANRFDRENEARKTLAQIMGGVFVLLGLYSSFQTLDLSREGQLTDRFSKAIEQLGAADQEGHPNLMVRLGGIYALERIARDSESDYPVVISVLTTYVRESPCIKADQIVRDLRKNQHIPPPCADIQAVLAVLGRRQTWRDTERLDLNRADLRMISLDAVDLRAEEASPIPTAVIKGANLSGSYLQDAQLNSAHLIGADLTGADLSGAHLEGADLRKADLRGAILLGVHLMGARIKGARFDQGVDLSNTDPS